MEVTTGGSQHDSDFAAEKRLRPLAAGGPVVLVAVVGGAWVKGQHYNMRCRVGFSKCQLTSAKTTITQVHFRKRLLLPPHNRLHELKRLLSSRGAAAVDSLRLNNAQPNYLPVNE